MLVKSRLLWVAAIALGTISLPLEGAEVSLPKPGQNWIEVETANFRFFSNAGRQATRRVAVDLEELRAVLSELTDYDLQAPIPTYIYVFRGDRSFLPYKTLYEGEPAAVSGYFIAADNANYIAVNADAKDASAIVYHEYVHYVANNNMWYLPVWFSEGLAEFYETFEVSGDTVYIGLPVLRHLIYARQSTPIPLEELMSVDRSSELYNEAARKGAFYAQSWALVHYLLLGNPERQQQVGQYLEMVRNGVAGEDAFQAAFATDYDSMERELRGYHRSLRLPWIETKAEIDIDKSIDIRKMSYGDVLYRLGDLLTHHRPRRSEGPAYFLAAIDADPNQGPSLSSLAVEAERSANWDTALKLHEKAAKATPDDPLVLYRYGRFLSRRGASHEQAASVLTRSAELDPTFAPVWASLAKVYADAGVTSPEAVESARIAYSMRPSNIFAARDLVRLYLRLDRRKEAVSLIEEAFRSNRRVQGQAWMMVMQQDLEKARELLQDNRTAEAMRRLDLAELLVERSMNPTIARHNIDSARRSIVEHQAADLFNQAQEKFTTDDRDGARDLLLEALSLVDDGPVASSSRRLLALLDHPEQQTQRPVSTVSLSPTASEIDQLNELIATKDFAEALAFLEGMRDRVSGDRLQWLDERIGEIQRTLNYNRFVDDYNRAVDLYNQEEYDEAMALLEALLEVLPDGYEADSARALLEDTQAARE
jgi:tetratricopeptide (TPR) repeat protein